jgi:hypothetical protein
MVRAPAWTEAELEIVRGNPGLPPADLAALLPGRSKYAATQARFRVSGGSTGPAAQRPAVRPPGRYRATLADLLVDEPGLLDIWLKWNGYARARETGRDGRGWVTLLCTAE